MIPGRGMGQGFPRVGQGGFFYCRCLVCGYEEEHRRSVPCNRIRCPRCGAALVGD